jgi:hypothetical protein
MSAIKFGMKNVVGLVYLAPEKAAFSTLLARTPQLKVVVPRVFNIQLA